MSAQGNPSMLRTGYHRAFALATIVMAMGCNAEKTVVTELQPANVALGTVRVSPLNAIIAVGDSISIRVSGKTIDGVPLVSFDSVLYRLQSNTDTIRVRVSPTGMVTGRASSDANPVLLDVYAFKNGTVRVDEAIIQVTPTAFSGATLSIQPAVDDSTRLAEFSSKGIYPVIENASTGQRVDGPQLRLSYHESDAAKLGCYAPIYNDMGDFTSAELSVTPCGQRVGRNQIVALARNGTAWVIATATVYGVELRDSVQYTFTNQFSYYIEMGPNHLDVYGGQSTYGVIYLAPGATVQFAPFFDPALGGTVSWTFSDPSGATATIPPSEVGGATGNVSALNYGETATRRFMTPGTYTYTSTVTGAIAPFDGRSVTGTIVIE